jgi:PKD repeat protein
VFDWRHIGENTVTLTVTDENGNTDTCETTVTVQPPAEGFPLVNIVSVPSEIDVDEGDSFTLTIRIEPDSVGQVTAADVAMSFDPALLQVTSVSLAPGTLLNTPSQPAVFDNNAGTLFAGGSNVLPASIAFDHVVINFQAVGSGNTTIAHITEGSPATTLSFAGFDVTGTTTSVIVNIGSIITDCAGVPGGTAFFDECGICVGGTTGLDECPQDCYGEYGGTAYFDPCGNCVGGNTGLDECVQDCHGVFGGEAMIDGCGQCAGGTTGVIPCEPDCNGDFLGVASIDACGVCRQPEDPDFNSTCADCLGVPNGNTLPGSPCIDGEIEGSYDANCTCIANSQPDPCRYFMSNHNTQGGSDVYELTINDNTNTASLNHLLSVPQRITLSYNHMANLLYLGRENNSTFQTYNPDGGNLGLPIGVNVGLSGFAGATYGPDGMLYAASQTSGAVYRFNPTNFTGSLFSAAQVNGGDIDFTADGELILVSRSPARAFVVNENGPNTILGPVPAGVSGLARRGDGTFLLSVQGYDKLIAGSTTEGDLGVRFDLKLNGAPFTPANGDLASGCAVPAAAMMVLTDTNLPVNAEEVGAKLASQPNPTEGSSVVTFTTETGNRATLEVYDVSGRSVATLFNADVQPGQEYRAEFNGAALPNGVYIYRLTTDTEVVIEKFMIAR